MENDAQELKKLVQNLAIYEQKLSSLSWNFWRGVIYGLGFFIGSALLAALLIYILARVGGDTAVGNFLNGIIENTQKTQS